MYSRASWRMTLSTLVSYFCLHCNVLADLDSGPIERSTGDDVGDW